MSGTNQNSFFTLKSPMKNYFVKKKYCGSAVTTESEKIKPFKVNIFPSIVGGIFLLFWIVMCPLTWALLYQTTHSVLWPHYWPYLFWTVALIVWLTIMLFLIIIWRRKTSPEIEKQPELKTEVGQSESLKMNIIKRNNEIEPMGAVVSDVVKLRRNLREESLKLPPLIIHRNLIGENENNSGDVTVSGAGVDEGNFQTPGPHTSRISQHINRSSIKEYLKIVTVETPSPPAAAAAAAQESSSSSSDAPQMSPRELFFIDLIREANNKKELNPPQYRKSYFFGEESVEKRSRDLRDTRRYTMGDDQFGKLIEADPDSHLKDHWKNLSANSETEIPRVIDDVNEEEDNNSTIEEKEITKKSESEEKIDE